MAVDDTTTAPPPDSALKKQLADLRASEALASQQRHHAALKAEAEERRHQWLAANDAAQKHFAALPELHQHAINSGLIDCSPSYFDFMNNQLAHLQAQRQHPTHLAEQMQARVEQDDLPPEAPKPADVGRLVSAPVSRDGSHYGASPRSIRLSREQVETARLAGISETEYADQLLKLRELQQAGHYSERR
jgi:hypothetical protein